MSASHGPRVVARTNGGERTEFYDGETDITVFVDGPTGVIATRSEWATCFMALHSATSRPND